MPKTSNPEQLQDAAEVTPLNSQALATVKHLAAQAKEGSDQLAGSAKALNAAMAHAIAAQDAAAHLRRVEIISEAALALAVQLMSEDKIAAGEAIIKATSSALSDAQGILAAQTA